MSLNPWLALILGILFGWFFGWLLERWFFRRRRSECEEELTRVERELRAQEDALSTARVRAGTLEADVAALKLAAEGPRVPTLQVATPSIEAQLPEVELEAPKVEVELPTAGIEEAEVEAAGSKLRLPDIELPDLDLDALKGKVTGGLAAVGAGLAGLVGREREEGALDGGQIEIPQVEETLPAIDFDRLGATMAVPEVALSQVTLPEVEIEAPRAEGELPDVEVGLPEAVLPALEVEVPKVEVEIETPKVELGAVLPAVELPKVELETPNAEVDWSALSAEVAQVEVEAPEVSVGAPSIGAELPAVEAGLPAAAVEVLATTPGVRADDLTLIKGIGPKFAAQLSAAGITSFAALAAADPARLKSVINAPEWRQVDYGAWVAEAQTLAAAAPVVAGDDLTRLEGIGPTYAGKLNAAGITTFAALAATDEARLAEIIGAPAWRKVNYGEWIQQARLAAAGDEAGLAELQARLFSRQGDNLLLVGGVGEKAAQALGAAGITSFAALAAASPERLAEITRTAGVRGGDFNAWIAEAGLRAAGKRVSKPKQVRAAKAVSCPQDLSRIKGIGSVFETKLYAAGIGTFWELSQADSETLAQILEVKDFQKVNLDAIKADALRLAEETGTLNRTWDGTRPDDFEPFEGIGEVYEGRLYDAGICTYRALASATVEQLAEICKAPEWRKPDYASWIAQAKRLSEA